MPEGDVVHRAATRLHAALSGGVVTVSDLRWPRLATVDLTGRPVVEVVSVGKHILMRLGPLPAPQAARADDAEPLTLHSHFRMDGSWHLHRPGEDFTSRPADGVRAVLSTRDWVAVGHLLGMLDLVGTRNEDELVGHLGPDVLGPGWAPMEAVHNLRADPARTVGEALLDQRVLAGVGTFYMAEALFVLGVTPWTPVGDIPDLPRLVGLLHTMLQQGVTRVVQSTTGDLRPGRRNYVHARAGRPCLRCGSRVRVEMVGTAPQARTAFFCPSCQRGPRPEGGGVDQQVRQPRRGRRSPGR